MKRMSFSETIFLFFLALVIFGPKKLPEIARQVGKVLNEFRRASNEFKAQIEQEIAHLEVEDRKKTILPPSPPLDGTESRTLNADPTGAAAPASPVEATTPPKPAAATSFADDEPLFASATHASPTNGAPGSGAAPAASPEPNPVTRDGVTSSTSQESHV